MAGIPLRRDSGGSYGRSPRAALGTVHLAPGDRSARGAYRMGSLAQDTVGFPAVCWRSATAAAVLFERLLKDKLPYAFIFARDDGHPWAHSDWDELIRDAAEKAGLPKGVCLYTLRHSFITQSLMDGMATLEVARITGTSLAMIEKHYGHLVMDAARTRLELVQLI